MFVSQHIPYIHEQLVEDFKLFDKAYRDAFRKSNGPTSVEDWAIVQKYKVQLTDSRLVFDQAFDEDFLSKEGIKEYLELLLYQNEFVKYHEILEGDVVNRFTSDEIYYYRELSSAWRMVKEQKSFRTKNWIYCAQFDIEPYLDPKNPNTEFTWVIEKNRMKAREFEYCFHNPGIYSIKLIKKNLLTGYYLPDTTFQYVLEEPMEAEFTDQPSISNIGEWMNFEIADSMKPMCEALWTMGDGKILLGNNVSHRYTVPGTYTVTQHLTYSEHNLDHVKSKSYQVYVGIGDKE